MVDFVAVVVVKMREYGFVEVNGRRVRGREGSGGGSFEGGGEGLEVGDWGRGGRGPA